MYRPVSLWDAPVLWTYETATCLTGVDFSDYQFISIDRKGFIPVMLESMENRLNPKSILYLKHQFQRSSCVIFLQKNSYTSFKLTRLEHLNPHRTNPSPRHPRSAVAGGTVPTEPAPSRPRRSRAAAAATHASPSLAPTASAPGCCGRRRPRRSRTIPSSPISRNSRRTCQPRPRAHGIRARLLRAVPSSPTPQI
jgi:hypothetical protein